MVLEYMSANTFCNLDFVLNFNITTELVPRVKTLEVQNRVKFFFFSVNIINKLIFDSSSVI